MAQLKYRAERTELGGLDCILVVPINESDEPLTPKLAGVFCHGFGAGGDDLVGIAGELLQSMGTEEPVVLAFPAAPIDLTDEGMPGGRAWWRLSIQRLMSALEDGRYEEVREEVPEGIDEARELLVGCVNALLEKFGLDHQRLCLGGFSQGAMLTVDAICRGLEHSPAIACLFSGALICERQWKKSVAKFAGVATVQSHGTIDPVLPLQTGKWLSELLTDGGCEVDFIEFHGPHTIPPEAIHKTALMLTKLLSETA